MSCATVRSGIASRTPNSTTRNGSSTAAPPKPATDASSDPTKAPPARSSRSDGETASGILLFADEREHAGVGEQMIFLSQRADLETAEDADERKVAQHPVDERRIDVFQAVERAPARAAVEIHAEGRRLAAEALGLTLEHLLQVLARALPVAQRKADALALEDLVGDREDAFVGVEADDIAHEVFTRRDLVPLSVGGESGEDVGERAAEILQQRTFDDVGEDLERGPVVDLENQVAVGLGDRHRRRDRLAALRDVDRGGKVSREREARDAVCRDRVAREL